VGYIRFCETDDGSRGRDGFGGVRKGTVRSEVKESSGENPTSCRPTFETRVENGSGRKERRGQDG
jgi:hypothetical protein